MKRYPLVVTGVALTLLFCGTSSRLLAQPPDGVGRPSDVTYEYYVVDLLSFFGTDHDCQGFFITNQDADGNALVYGRARLDDDNSVPFGSALWHIDPDGNYPLTDAENRGIPSWSFRIEQTGINSSGVMIGNTVAAIEKDSDGQWVFPAYVDIPGEDFQEIPSPTRSAFIYGINDFGQIVGVYQERDENGNRRYVSGLWQLNADNTISGPQSLGFRATGINNWGVMCGNYFGAPAIGWFQDGALVTLSAVQFRGADANALNDYPIGDENLTIVGDAGFRGAFAWRPFDAANPATLLGTLGGSYTHAADVNNHGEIVGWSETADEPRHAFIYRNDQMTDLNSLVDVGSVDRHKSTLWSAASINDDHDIVGKWAQPRPVVWTHGYLLRLNPPTTGE